MSITYNNTKRTSRCSTAPLQHLCTKAEKQRDNCPKFCMLLTQIHPLFEELRKENLPESEEISQLSERVTSLQLATFNLQGLCEIQEIAFSFFSYLSSQERIPVLCVNKDWNAAFQEFAKVETHNTVTAHLDCLKHNLNVLDAHLNSFPDRETASSIRCLIHNSQRNLQNFNRAHWYSENKWSVFDVEDLETDIQSTLANALKAVEPQNCNALLSCIEKDHPSAFFESLRFLIPLFSELDQPNLSNERLYDIVTILIDYEQFGKAYEQIPLIDAKHTRREAAQDLIRNLARVGRLNNALELAQILLTDPARWLPQEDDSLPGMYVTCVSILWQQQRFNKAIEVISIIKQYPYQHNRGINTIVEALADKHLFKKAIETALMASTPDTQITVLLKILPLQIELNKFAEAVETVLILKKLILEIAEDPKLKEVTSEKTVSCAGFIMKIPSKYFKEKGTDKMTQLSINELLSIAEKKMQIGEFAIATQISKLIPANNKEAHAQLTNLFETYF